MTVTGFLGSVQNCNSTGEKASLLLSNYRKEKLRQCIVTQPAGVKYSESTTRGQHVQAYVQHIVLKCQLSILYTLFLLIKHLP